MRRSPKSWQAGRERRKASMIQAIFIAGVSGSGKTTLSNALADEWDAGVLHGDEAVPDSWPDDWDKWLDEVGDIRALDGGPVRKAAERLLAQHGRVVVDSAFAPLLEEFDTVAGLRVFVDVPCDMAFARRLGRYFQWHETDASVWPRSRVYRAVALDVRARLEGPDARLMKLLAETLHDSCELHIDGLQAPSWQVAEVLQHLRDMQAS